MACEVGLYYVLHVAKQRNKNALLRLLPGLGECVPPGPLLRVFWRRFWYRSEKRSASRFHTCPPLSSLFVDVLSTAMEEPP